MRLSERPPGFFLRNGIVAGVILLGVMVLALFVSGLLGLLGDNLGRAVALVIGLIAFFGLFVDLCVVVGLLASHVLDQLDAENESGETE